MKTGRVGSDLLKLGFNTKEKQREVLLRWFRSTLLLDLDGDALTAKVIKYGTHETEPNRKHLITDEDRYKEFLIYIKGDKEEIEKFRDTILKR